MKHLKTYENINILKKYVIWINKYSMEILELDTENINSPVSDNTWSKTLYEYINNKLVLVNYNPYLLFRNKDKAIKYTSNDLQDCIDKFQIIIDQEKYNI
jgi:hypothetical protein